MGGSKRLLEEREAELNHVISMLVEHGAADVCEHHDYPVDAEDGDAVQAVKDALAVEMDPQEANDLVEDAVANLYWECPGCAANARD